MQREDQEALGTPSTDLAAPASAEVGALDLMTMKPKAYVAEVFKPFHSKFDELTNRARLVVLGTEDEAALEAELMALPDGQRPDLALIEKVDVSTTAGMATAIELRAAFRDDVRLAAEKTYRARKDPLIEVGRLLDSGFKSIKELSEPHEKRFDRAIKDEQARKEREKEEKRLLEEQRVAAIRAKIIAISEIPASLVGKPSADITAELVKLDERTVTAEEFAEFAEQAQMEIDNVGEVLIGMRDAAIEREQAEVERVRQQEEEQARIEAMAEANRIEAARLEAVAQEARELAARVEAQRLEQERVEAVRQADAKRQAQAMADIRSIQQMGEIEGTRAILTALESARGMELAAEKFGAVLDLATMAREAVVTKLENKLAALLAIEVPAAHAEALEIELDRAHGEALEEDLQHEAARAMEKSGQRYSATTFKDNGEPILLNADGSRSIFCDVDDVPDEAPDDAARHRAAVAEKLPVCYEQADEAVNAGEPIEVTDLWIIDLVASELGLTRAQTFERFQEIDMLQLAFLCEAED